MITSSPHVVRRGLNSERGFKREKCPVRAAAAAGAAAVEPADDGLELCPLCLTWKLLLSWDETFTKL